MSLCDASPALSTFQSTRPRGARPDWRGGPGQRCDVSIHAPTRGATPAAGALRADPRRFNPRAHAGRDTTAAHARTAAAAVSIHAPTRGATGWRNRGGSPRPCFNPRAHAGRDLRDPWRGLAPRSCFNPRAHAGRDVGGFAHGDLQRYVSIHAPTRGATPCASWRARGCSSFNPRAHAGRDCRGRCARRGGGVSIHAPTRGATRRTCRERQPSRVSIHAPTRGATGAGFAGDARDRVSIHAPTRGATPSSSHPHRPQKRFNPRAHAGRDR